MKHFKLTSLSIAALIGVLTANAGYAEPVPRCTLENRDAIAAMVDAAIAQYNRALYAQCRIQGGFTIFAQVSPVMRYIGSSQLTRVPTGDYNVTGGYCEFSPKKRCAGGKAFNTDFGLWGLFEGQLLATIEEAFPNCEPSLMKEIVPDPISKKDVACLGAPPLD